MKVQDQYAYLNWYMSLKSSIAIAICLPVVYYGYLLSTMATCIVLHGAMRVNYLKDPKKSHAQNRKSYMKDLEKSPADSAARSCESYEKDLEKSRWNETGLASMFPFAFGVFYL